MNQDFSKAPPMLAIETRFCGPTNTCGSRIIATTANGHKLVMPYSAGEGGFSSHRLAAVRLAERMDWVTPGVRWYAGATARGYVFVRGE